jgi:phosphoribosylaminoimidazolecarboxamide formyltransferase / IMP cyclohydrolase
MLRKTIQNALISVFYKDGLEPVVQKLHESGVRIISTGGTYDFITSLGISATKVEELTTYPDLFGGRVKTLHPVILGGILFRRDTDQDVIQAEQHGIPAIDLVIVDLYPFEETLKRTDKEEEIIEKIDIGGISLIRAAAKNHSDVLIVPSRDYYGELLQVLNEENGSTDITIRKKFATYAFQVSSHYDTGIFQYFNREVEIPAFRESLNAPKVLRYGENPHQKGSFFGNVQEIFTQLGGKEISYNNFQDIESAFELVHEFSQPAFVIVKHGNACGVAVRQQLTTAWEAALSCDPLSAFGGVLACNVELDIDTAQQLNEIFFEVLAAPSFSEAALELLSSKKNRILLQTGNFKLPSRVFKSCLNGVLVQDRDNAEMDPSDWKIVTKRQITDDKLQDLVFANTIVRHTKSNAIVIAANNMLYGSGMGQTSRIDAVRLAIAKARAFNHDLNGAVMASDAFFPFADSLELAMKEGIEYIIQPGGSIRDHEVIDFCNTQQLAMVFTGTRHFKH